MSRNTQSGYRRESAALGMGSNLYRYMPFSVSEDNDQDHTDFLIARFVETSILTGKNSFEDMMSVSL